MERSVLARRLGIGIGAIATVAMAVIAAAPWPRPGASASTQAEILLLYVGADDCAPCRVWQNGEGAAFRASAQFARLSYREVKSATLLDVLKDEHWPDDLRGYRDRLGAGAGGPGCSSALACCGGTSSRCTTLASTSDRVRKTVTRSVMRVSSPPQRARRTLRS